MPPKPPDGSTQAGASWAATPRARARPTREKRVKRMGPEGLVERGASEGRVTMGMGEGAGARDGRGRRRGDDVGEAGHERE